MTYRKYFDSDDPNGPQQFFDAIAGQATSRTMGRDEKGAFVEYSVSEPAQSFAYRHAFNYAVGAQCDDDEHASAYADYYERNFPEADVPHSNVYYDWAERFSDDSGFIDIGRLPVLPLAIALVAGYAIHFMAMHGIFASLSILAR